MDFDDEEKQMFAEMFEEEMALPKTRSICLF
jgi:hypothetical protein